MVVRPLGDAGHAEASCGQAGLAQTSAGDGTLGARPAQQQLAVVAAGPGQQRRRAQLGMSPDVADRTEEMIAVS